MLGKHLKENEVEELKKLRRERRYYEKIVNDVKEENKELKKINESLYIDNQNYRQCIRKIEGEFGKQQYNSVINLINKIKTIIKKELSTACETR